MLGIITNKSSSNSVVYLDSNLIKYIDPTTTLETSVEIPAKNLIDLLGDNALVIKQEFVIKSKTLTDLLYYLGINQGSNESFRLIQITPTNQLITTTSSNNKTFEVFFGNASGYTSVSNKNLSTAIASFNALNMNSILSSLLGLNDNIKTHRLYFTNNLSTIDTDYRKCNLESLYNHRDTLNLGDYWNNSPNDLIEINIRFNDGTNNGTETIFITDNNLNEVFLGDKFNVSIRSRSLILVPKVDMNEYYIFRAVKHQKKPIYVPEVPAPTNLSYTTPNVFNQYSVITSLSPTVTGDVTSYSIIPSLPLGLLLNTTSGVISGTPTIPSVNTTYTVTASNSSGSVSANLNIQVLAVVPDPLTATLQFEYIAGEFIFTLSNPIPSTDIIIGGGRVNGSLNNDCSSKDGVDNMSGLITITKGTTNGSIVGNLPFDCSINTYNRRPFIVVNGLQKSDGETISVGGTTVTVLIPNTCEFYNC